MTMILRCLWKQQPTGQSNSPLVPPCGGIGVDFDVSPAPGTIVFTQNLVIAKIERANRHRVRPLEKGPFNGAQALNPTPQRIKT